MPPAIPVLNVPAALRLLDSDGDAVDRAGKQECHLLGKFGSFGWWLQVFLGSACFCSLIYKRFTDPVRRPWRIWFMDTSKQGFGQLMGHFLNIGLSKAFDEWLTAEADPCEWYWINLSMDCTLGLIVIFCSLRILQRLYRSRWVNRPELAKSGEYGDPPDMRIFRRQLLDYQGLVFWEKVVLTGITVNFQTELAAVANGLLGWLDTYPRAKLIVVMVITPIFLNIFFLWMADNLLQNNHSANSLPSEAISLVDNPSVDIASVNGDPAADTIGHVSFESWKQQRYAKVQPKQFVSRV